MRITINNKEVKLNKEEVYSARRQIAELLSSVKKTSEDNNRMSYFFTYLIVMHVMSQQSLDDLDPAIMQRIINAFNDNDSHDLG